MTATDGRSMILIEFNELTRPLMERFIAAGELPNFERFRSESQVFLTDAEEAAEKLNPWIQWVTVHTGLSADEHGVFRLDEGHRLEQRAVWDELSDAGFKVWICGSMNPRYDEGLKGCLLPDPWSTGLAPYPRDMLDTYYQFVRTQVQEHSKEEINGGSALRFLAYMARNGLSLKTVGRVGQQLSRELAGNAAWRRAALLDWVQWDLFRHVYARLSPAFSTFFLNSTAHFQHHYWRQFEPERFGFAKEHDDRGQSGAILYGYKNMDQLIGQFMRLAGSSTTLVFCTGLSQQPYTASDDEGGRHYYRLISPDALKERLGIQDDFQFRPVMAEQFHLIFADEERARRAHARLYEFRVRDERVFEPPRNRLFHLELHGTKVYGQCRCTRSVPEDAVVEFGNGEERIRFHDLFYPMGEVKSGQHHPEGMLWVRHPSREHRVHETAVSIRAIAPAILTYFGLPIPRRMSCEPFVRMNPQGFEWRATS